ncbi:GNAT family N-acetyltransferase [Dactylosporangium sp. McL0621]|uniref:GNAT family N-acetyltransferase n=1 Tax=Dactylosporangium sp. McL0621 TaxID=3415678 RepID=UPI003CF864E0
MHTNAIHDLQPQLTANRRYWSGWASSSPDTDLPIYRTGIQQGLLNGVLRIRNRGLDEAIEEARRQLAGTQWSWWVGADSDEGTAEGLLARGAELTVDMPVMAVDVTTVTSPAPAPTDLKIRLVSDRAEMYDYVRAYAEPLGFPADDLDTVVDREMRHADTSVVRLAGIVDGKTVGTCTLALATDIGALYCIATDRDHRRRGVATALTMEALRITRDSGRRIATLQASSEGEPVYRRIGFATVSRYRLFRLPG